MLLWTAILLLLWTTILLLIIIINSNHVIIMTIHLAGFFFFLMKSLLAIIMNRRLAAIKNGHLAEMNCHIALIVSDHLAYFTNSRPGVILSYRIAATRHADALDIQPKLLQSWLSWLCLPMCLRLIFSSSFSGTLRDEPRCTFSVLLFVMLHSLVRAIILVFPEWIFLSTKHNHEWPCDSTYTIRGWERGCGKRSC